MPKLPLLTARFQIGVADLEGRLHAPKKARSAQFNLSSLPNIARADSFHALKDPVVSDVSLPAFGTPRAGPHCQRTCFEGTKKPIGWFALLPWQHRDRHLVSRPPSFVAAREAS
jgi:hypothetical protein